MLDVIRRSQCGRICEFSNGRMKLRTPFVLRDRSDDVSGTILSDEGRTVRILGKEIAVDPKFPIPVAFDVAAQPVTKDGMTVLRLPVTGDEIIPGDSEVIIVPNAFEVKGDFR